MLKALDRHIVKTENEQEGRSSVGILLRHMELRDRALRLNSGFQVQQAEAFIERDVEDVKLAVLKHWTQIAKQEAR